MASSNSPTVGLGSIEGQPRAIATLRAAIASGRLHHALLFSGPPGVGKGSTARALAAALNCDEGPSTGGCGTCSSCERIASGNHPDYVVLDMTPKGLTDRVRELVTLMGYPPHEGRVRVVVIDPAHQLASQKDEQGRQRAEAANVLLKTLEEPPARTHFVLVTSEPDRLPITIRSRCQRIAFTPLSAAVIESLLAAHSEDREAARIAASLSDGSLARALGELTGDARVVERQQLLTALVDGLVAPSLPPRDLFDLAAKLGADREAAESVCTALGATLRDGARLAATSRSGASPGDLPEARQDAASRLSGVPVAWLLSAARRAEAARTALRGFVAPALVFEHLLLELRELRPDSAARGRAGTP